MSHLEALPADSPDDTRRLVARPPGDDAAPVVVVEGGGPLGLCRRIGPSALTVGRMAGLALVLEDASVSRVHAALAYRHGRVELQDFGSTNGTWLDGRRVSHAEVRDGASVRIGETLLRVFHRRRTRAELERARLQLALWRSGRDPVSRLPHGARLRADLLVACARAETTDEDVSLLLLDVAEMSRRIARRLQTALASGQRAYRHGTRRLAVLGPALLEATPTLVRASGAVAWGEACSRAVDHDPDRLLLAAAAGCRPT